MVVDNYDDDEQIVVINYLAFRHSNSKSCNIVLPNGYYAFFSHTKRFSIRLNSIFVSLCVCWVNVSFLRLLFFLLEILISCSFIARRPGALWNQSFT